MNKNELQITLSVKDDGSVTIKNFGKTGEDSLNQVGAAGKKASGSINAIKDSYVELGAKAATVYMAIQKSIEYMDRGVKDMQAEDSFNRLMESSGKAADEIVANMKQATAGTIDESQLMQRAVKASTLDFTTDQIEKMAEMARVVARTTGDDVGVAFDNIVNALSTNMPRSLKQMGLVTKEQMSLINQAMAEGVDDVNLYSIAVDNMNNMSAKHGDLVENEAEKMQKYKATIDEVEEGVGKLAYAIGASVVSLSSKPMDNYFNRLAGLSKEESGEYEIVHAVKPTQPNSAEEALRKAQQEMAQRKADLETMKSLNKTYFADQESLIKNNLDLVKATEADEYQATKGSLEKRIQLLTEFYDKTEQEIKLEAETRSKADREKLSDAQYVAEKTKALDADVAAKNRQIQNEKLMLSITTAQADLKNLKTRLTDYQSYYDKLKALMDKNTEEEKKHLDQIKALRKQSADLDTSAAAMIAGIKGTDSSLAPQQQYESARSALTSQYANALNLSGQEEIDALEKYKQAVAALQSQYAQGISGGKNIFGNTSEIISAAQIASDAISDIERATQNQKNALAALTAEQEIQIEADRQWGQVLQEEAFNAQTNINNLSNTIYELSQDIMNMQTTITLNGVDNVSSLVNNIINRLEYMHSLASQPVSIGSGYSSGSSATASMGGFTDIPFALGSYAEGTDYVPKTGLYQLHQGEKVVPADENKASGLNVNGDIVINVPASAATKTDDDWRWITRNCIVPELKKMMS